MQPDCHITLAGQEVVLLPEKAMFLPNSYTLLVADVHLGKAAALRAAAIAVPGGTTATDFMRLNKAIDRTGAKSLIVLGDLLHAQPGMTKLLLEMLGEWRDKYKDLPVTLVRGNHDKKCKPLPAEFNIEVVPEHMELGPFTLCHDPSECADGYILAGHLHPCVTLQGKGHQYERLPCFWLGGDRGVLPAFGSFTGCMEVQPKPEDGVYVIADNKVIPVHEGARAR